MFFKNRSLIAIKSKEELEIMASGAKILAQVHALVSQNIKEGVTPLYLDKLVYTYISDNAAKPSFLNYNGYPNSLCVSVNDTVVHGIPSNIPFKSGDVVSVDCGVHYLGYHTDSAYTYTVGEVSVTTRSLLKATLEALYKGIDEVRIGKRIGDIAYAVQSHVERQGFSVVRELVGHGIGKKLHEPPEVPNYGKKGQGVLLKKGMVLAIEPMINEGSKNVFQDVDGWTIKTVDGKPSAHFEHTVAVWDEEPLILTSFENIDVKYRYL